MSSSVCLYRLLSRFAEGPPASRSLLLEDGDFLGPVCHHVHLAGLGCLCPPRETVKVQLHRPCMTRIVQPTNQVHVDGDTHTLTQEVVRRQRLEVPHLHDENGWKLLLGFIQRENVFSLAHDHDL